MIKLQGKSQIINHDESLWVTREGITTYVDGKPVSKSPTRFEIICSVQPLNSRDLLIVPEGDRFKEQYYVWSQQIKRPLEINDMVARQGINFQVQSTENWGSYTRSRIMRVDVGNAAN